MLRPTFPNALYHRTIGYSCYFRPFLDGFSLSVNCDVMTSAAIILLLFSSRPNTITRLIVSIVVKAFYSATIARWLTTHVRKEILKNEPTLTNRNPAPAVVGRSRICRISAACYYVTPRPVFRCLRLFMQSPECAITPNRTATMAGLPFHQCARIYKPNVATVASAFPKNKFFGRSFVGSGYNSQQVELSSDKSLFELLVSRKVSRIGTEHRISPIQKFGVEAVGVYALAASLA